MSDEEQTIESVFTRLGGDVRKADTKAMITNGSDAFPADSFEGVYWSGGSVGSNVGIIEPVFKPGSLHAIAVQNNTLSQCIEAMEVNIDGTGHSIELVKEGEAESDEDAEKVALQDFFREPFPGKSMIEIRRAMRRDLEASGNGYFEVIRDAQDNVVLTNFLDCQDVRMVRFDDAVPVAKEVVRAGKVVSVTIRTRERRFVQAINGKKVYFKEFGASRDLDRDTGAWVAEGQRLPVERRASEIIHFAGNKEPKTPYGTPRWINQMPSVLGSRKAEEHNLEFFDGGGIPPVLVIVEGGTLGEKLRADLKKHLSGVGGRSRAAIVEAISTSGTIDSAGSVRVRVERFGAERQQDSMFQKYDAETSEHVRIAFRLPPMFLGKAQDYNFATAYTAYMVAEAQVFYPERDEFDSKINNTIVKALGIKKYKFRSLPLTLTDIANQLKAIELVTTAKVISGEEIVSKLNEITGLSMEYTEPPAPPPAPAAPATGTPAEPAVPANGIPVDTPTKKSEPGDYKIPALVAEWVESIGLHGDSVASRYSETAKDRIHKAVFELTPDETKEFNRILAAISFSSAGTDMEGLSELCECANALVGS